MIIYGVFNPLRKLKISRKIIIASYFILIAILSIVTGLQFLSSLPTDCYFEHGKIIGTWEKYDLFFVEFHSFTTNKNRLFQGQVPRCRQHKAEHNPAMVLHPVNQGRTGQGGLEMVKTGMGIIEGLTIGILFLSLGTNFRIVFFLLLIYPLVSELFDVLIETVMKGAMPKMETASRGAG